MEMEMGWTGLLDEGFSSLRGMLDEGEGDDDFYSTIGANGGTLEALLGYSQICPNGSNSLSNVGGTVNAFDHLDCSIITGADTPDPEGSDESGLLQRQDEIESGLHKNGGKQKLNGAVGGREADAAHDANNKNNNGYANASSVGRGRKNRFRAKNGFPAKNLMAERRRRKKLNDRLFMLRSVVPKVSKMDRASTLADAVDYMKELLQRIKDLHTELLSGSSNLKPLAPTLPDVSCRMNQGYQASLLNPELKTAKVDVRTRQGKSLDIHMFCSRKPDLLLSTISALDGLGLELKHAAISCLDGFGLDVFQAKQSMGEDVTAEEIKALLLHTAGYVTGM